MKKILLTTCIIGLALSLNAQEAAQGSKDKKCGEAARVELRKGPRHAEHSEGKMMHKGHRQMDAQTMAVKKALRLKEALLLSDKQFDEVYKLYYESFQSFEKKIADKKSAPVSPEDEAAKEARRAERKAAHAEQVASLEKPMKKILSDEQFKRWKELETTEQHPRGARQGSDKRSGQEGA